MPRVSASVPRPLIALVAVGVVVVVGYDAARIGLLRLSAADDARSAASAGASTYHVQRTVQAAYAAAEAVATSHGGHIAPTDFTVMADGRVTLTMSDSTTTLVVGRIRPSLQRATAAATGSYTA